MSKRRGGFSRKVKDRVWQRQDGRCFVTGEPLNNPELHHWMALSIWRKYFPWIPQSLIESDINAIYLNRDVHRQLHNQITLKDYELIAKQLMLEWKQLELISVA